MTEGDIIMFTKRKLLFGTTNLAKFERLKAIVITLPLEILSLSDLNIDLEIEENEQTLEENALKKAGAYFRASKIPTFSMDSGLYIDKFPKIKQPSVFVRRINGKRASDEEMLNYYLDELNKVGGESKGRWVNSVALIISDNKIFTRNFIEETYFTSKKSPVEKKDQPLSSIQIDLTYNKYKSEITLEERSKLQNKLDKELFEFFKKFIEHI